MNLWNIKMYRDKLIYLYVCSCFSWFSDLVYSHVAEADKTQEEKQIVFVPAALGMQQDLRQCYIRNVTWATKVNHIYNFKFSRNQF